MTPEIKLKKLKELKKSKWWELLLEKMLYKRSNAALLVLNRAWQSNPEFTMDDLLKKEISTINWVVNILDSKYRDWETDRKSVV